MPRILSAAFQSLPSKPSVAVLASFCAFPRFSRSLPPPYRFSVFYHSYPLKVYHYIRATVNTKCGTRRRTRRSHRAHHRLRKHDEATTRPARAASSLVRFLIKCGVFGVKIGNRRILYHIRSKRGAEKIGIIHALSRPPHKREFS